MGLDIHVQLFCGYRIPLSVAFDSNLIDPEILNTDDYQLISDEEYRDEIIEKWVKSDMLKHILKDTEWNLFILTSSQTDANPEESDLYLYNLREQLFYDRAPDYTCGEVDIQYDKMNGTQQVFNISLNGGEEWDYKMHWVLESSW